MKTSNLSQKQEEQLKRQKALNKKRVRSWADSCYVLEKLLKDTVRDMQKKGVQVPHEDIMIDIEGGKLIISPDRQKDGIKFKIMLGSEKGVYGRKDKNFAKVNISIPIWNYVLSVRSRRKKYWKALKSITAHEIFHGKEDIQNRNINNKKKEQIISKIRKKIYNLEENQNVIIRRTPNGGFTALMIAPSKENIIGVAKGMNKIDNLMDKYKKYKAPRNEEEREARDIMYNIYGKEGKELEENMNKYVISKVLRNLKYNINKFEISVKNK